MPPRLLCELIDLAEIPEAVLAGVKANFGSEWSTSLAYIADLRRHLLVEQRYQCAYCQVQILADANGLRELDHVLPKAAPAWLDASKASSADVKDRYHTNGYPDFRFEPLNIVLVCKQCNTHKSTFDPLTDRTGAITAYPEAGIDFQWVHPHFCRYSEHIAITSEWLYQFKSDQGQTLVKVCKLDDAEVLGRRMMAHAYAAQSKDLADAIWKLSAQHDRLTTRESVDALCERFGIVREDAEKIVTLCFEAGASANTELLCAAIEVARRLQVAE